MSELSRRDFVKAAALAPLCAAGASDAAGGEATSSRAFVLVHGAWHGGWCFARVARMLRSRGHEVYSPTLTGLGERSHLARTGVNCSTHVQDVLNLFEWEQLRNVVLCGHSYGGMIIAAVADRIPQKVSSLVFLDAVIPEQDASILDVMGAQAIVPLLQASGEYRGELLPAPSAEAFGVNAADRAIVDALCTPQPIATVTERLHFSGAYLQVATKVYVRATGWDNHALERFARRARKDPAWKTVDVSCGHDVMLDAPDRLSEILLDAA